MSTRYANATTVSVSASREELERTITKYGATKFAYAHEEGSAVVMFEAGGRRVRFMLKIPRRDLHEFTRSSRGPRSAQLALATWEQACRQRWRALNLAVKAKLEAVEAEIATFEEEFAAYIVLPDGTTVGDRLIPEIDLAYKSGLMPSSMLAIGPGV